MTEEAAPEEAAAIQEPSKKKICPNCKKFFRRQAKSCSENGCERVALVVRDEFKAEAEAAAAPTPATATVKKKVAASKKPYYQQMAELQQDLEGLRTKYKTLTKDQFKEVLQAVRKEI